MPVSRSKLVAALVVFLPGLLLLIFTFVWKRLVPQPSRVPGSLLTLRLTGTPANDVSPSFSPDSARLVYSSDRSGEFRLYIHTMAPPHEEELTPTGGPYLRPAWSPDGQTIAYDSGCNNGISVIPASGGASRRMASAGCHPAWSPDGQWIAYQSEDTASVIEVVPSQGGTARPLTLSGKPAGSHSAPSWSPDGARIVFAAGDAAVSLWTVTLDGALMEVPVAPGPYFSPRFSSDGRGFFYFARAADGNSTIQLLLLQPNRIGPVEVLRTRVPGPLDLSVSADGKLLAYAPNQVAGVAGDVFLVEVK